VLTGVVQLEAKMKCLLSPIPAKSSRTYSCKIRSASSPNSRCGESIPPFTVKCSYPVGRRASGSRTSPSGGGVMPSRQSTRRSPASQCPVVPAGVHRRRGLERCGCHGCVHGQDPALYPRGTARQPSEPSRSTVSDQNRYSGGLTFFTRMYTSACPR